jgi:hypothetical protein
VKIFVQNKSTLVTDLQVYNMTLCVSQQARSHMAPAFGITPPQVAYLPAGAVTPAGSYVIGVLDDADQAGDLGWHSEGPGGVVYGRVFVRPVLQNGGSIMTTGLSVASVLSHEVLETIGDQHCNLWADVGDGTAIAYEVGDPVESDSYPLVIAAAGGESITAMVSNFVLPAWFDPMAPHTARFDYMQLTKGPFQVRDTGYVIVLAEGSVSQHWGEHYPAWKKETKAQETSRTARIAARHAAD